MRNPFLCHPQRPILYGTCQDDRYIVDAVELVMNFKKVIELFEREKQRADEWWCWVVGWIMDVLEVIAFADGKGLYVDPGMLHKTKEFGVSLTSLTLKVICSDIL